MMTEMFDRLDAQVARKPLSLHRRWDRLAQDLLVPG
jgi:hypothetical protein